MSVSVDLQDGQVLKTHKCRASLKAKLGVLCCEKSFGMNFLSTYCYHILEMAMTKSKCIERRRRGSVVVLSDDHVSVVWLRAFKFVFECTVF